MTPQEVIIRNVAGFKPRQPIPVKDKQSVQPHSFETVTVSNVAIGLTAPTYDVMGVQSKAFITVETASIRFRLDGTNPTSSVGHLAAAGDTIRLDSIEEIEGFKAIRTASTNATLCVSYSEVV